MDIEKDIIQDQKETIHRLQEECKEKTDIIMALEQENAELKEEIKDEIKNTVDMERLSKENLRLYNEEHALNNKYKEFISYVESVCKERMTFENPNKDMQTCLNFIDRTFDDLLLRINDLKQRSC